MDNNKIVRDGILYQSLFDFLGKAAGSELGLEVAAVASKEKVTIKKRTVKTKKYTGIILVYPYTWLKQLFTKNEKFKQYAR